MLLQKRFTLVCKFLKVAHTKATLDKNRVLVTKRGVVRWVRPAIEHAQDVPLVIEARSGVYFYGLLVQSLFLCSTFCFNFVICFSLFCFVCVLFSKKESFGVGLSFDFFVFYLIVVKI